MIQNVVYVLGGVFTGSVTASDKSRKSRGSNQMLLKSFDQQPLKIHYSTEILLTHGPLHWRAIDDWRSANVEM